MCVCVFAHARVCVKLQFACFVLSTTTTAAATTTTTA